MSKSHKKKSPTLRAAASRAARAAAALGRGAATATRKTLGPKSPAIRAAKAIGRGAKKAWKADASTSARKTAAARARRLRGAAHDGIRAILAGAWTGIKKRDRHAALARLKDVWARRRKNRAGKNTPTAAPPVVAPTVRRPTTTSSPTASTGGTSMPGHHFVAPAMEMARIAANYDPQGMLQVGEDFSGLEEALRLTAEAMKVTVEHADARQPLAPQIIEMMRQIHSLQLKAAEMASELRPAFESLHQVDLNRLRNPRKGAAGERMWDVTTNLS
ncbi:hypothetical protein OG552_10595 [Streptomyces sp. NBC_01476]|uniref:hypothetical protein n=1 Tax=Streptomyces sp. NBC_01476 TaxID=2903881 RepID=UPI002E30B0AF|nr:hypothetical protein [Streptomyces sp. NBC_01476]